ncbi:hypothetical protein B1R32_10668 [Abditibacterium utsteinense]|uniref:Uncharacterized protein n=1 Tax=Abditibacterium utsteinense TaxID=1960156 RepID=A0A2S8STT8_9BACT|nr:hypothetical protein [Abditibacterium utsteinense]PQV64223.1 hypothetical protein B1R32_10668 [Abditibacterium utsteinense]
MKRRFRPIYLAALCWILIALFPSTRNQMIRAGNAPFSPTAVDADGFTTGVFEREAMRRFPDDRRVQLDALARENNNTSTRKMEAAARKFGDDATAISLVLRAYGNGLKSDRNEGPLSNPNFPRAAPKKLPGGTSPRAEWDRFISLARRGQKLEPNNTFFDWQVLYGLFATRRDDEARAVLKLAARKTDFDDHSQDVMLNRLAVMRLVYGAPLSPRENAQSWQSFFSEFSKSRQTARWIMEGVIADRGANRHGRALDAAFDLTKLARVMRRESHFLIGSLVGTAIQTIAMRSVNVVPNRSTLSKVPLSKFIASPNTLHAYAKSQNRADITRFLDRESPEINRWRKLPLALIDKDRMGNSTFSTLALTAAERLRAFVLRALPSILILGAIFTLLSRRFRDDSGAPVGGFWRGAWAGAVLLPLALVFDAVVVWRGTSPDSLVTIPGSLEEWAESYFGDNGLLVATPTWITVGFALATVLLAAHAAVIWQKRQIGESLPLKTRFKTVFDAPEDGLMRFDFGWILGLAVRCTMWIVLLGALAAFCFNPENMRDTFGFEIGNAGAALMGFAFSISLILHLEAWRNKPRRRATLRLGLRLISGSLLGFFVASSVLFALVSFALLPLAFRFERNFQSAIERGEVKIARAKLGL